MNETNPRDLLLMSGPHAYELTRPLVRLSSLSTPADGKIGCHGREDPSTAKADSSHDSNTR